MLLCPISRFEQFIYQWWLIFIQLEFSNILFILRLFELDLIELSFWSAIENVLIVDWIFQNLEIILNFHRIFILIIQIFIREFVLFVIIIEHWLVKFEFTKSLLRIILVFENKSFAGMIFKRFVLFIFINRLVELFDFPCVFDSAFSYLIVVVEAFFVHAKLHG